jgi:hypothetical protein
MGASKKWQSRNRGVCYVRQRMYRMEMQNDNNKKVFWTQESWDRLEMEMQDNMKEKGRSPWMQFGNFTYKTSLTTMYLCLPRPTAWNLWF